MALWGNRDRKTGSGTIQSVDADGNVVGSGTAFTTEAKIGNTIYTDGREYLIVTIEDDTNCVVRSGTQGGVIDVGSSYSYTLSEKPAFMAAAESASTNGVSGDSTKVYGVDGPDSNGENYASAGRVVEVGVANAGTGYTEVPSVAFSGGGGANAAATATISGGSVASIAVTNNGSSYEDVPSVFVGVPRRTILMAGVNTSTEVITYVSHGMANGEQIKYYANGGTVMGGLTNATSYYAGVINADTFYAYDTRVNALAGGATGRVNISGTGNDDQYFDLLDAVTATAVAALGGGNGADESVSNITHTGWVRRITGTGGRAGRVQYETLVAMGSITGDQADDRQFPDD